MTPSTVQVPTSDNYVSTIDIHKPHIRKELIIKYQGQSMTDFFETTGRSEPVDQTEYFHYLEDYIHLNVKSAGVVAQPGAGVDQVVTLSAADHDAGGTLSYPQEDEVVQYANGDLGLIVAKNTATPGAHTITIRPFNSATNLPALVANDVIIIITGAYAEGTGQPDGRTPKPIKYSNKTQIIKESFEVTGSEMTNLAWVEVEGTEFGDGFYWYLKGEKDTYKRMKVKVELAMLLSEGNDNLGNVNTTEGLVPFARSGNNQNYSFGTYNLPKFDTMIKTLDKQFGSYENTIWSGIDLRQEYDNFLTDIYKEGGVSYGSFGNDKEIGVALGFKSFSRLGYVFHLKTYKAFNHPTLMGSAGYQYPGMGLMLPSDEVMDAKSKEFAPSVRIRYKSNGAYNRDMEHFLTGSAYIKTPTNDTDELRCHYRCEKGFEGMASNRFFLIERV